MSEEGIRRKVEDATRGLVLDARAFLDAHPVYASGKALGSTAVRNVLDVSLTASCLDEVEAFVQYQVGRDYDRWMGGKEFGTALAKHLGADGPIAKMAKPAAQEEPRCSAEGLSLALAQVWLGFLYRHFRYCDTLQRREDANRQPGNRGR